MRSTWDVPALALIGVGSGAQVAPGVRRIPPGEGGAAGAGLPVAPSVSAEAAAEDQVKGQEAALDAFAAQCVAVNCRWHPDPKGR